MSPAKPLTRDLLMPRSMLYRGSPNVKEADIAAALDGLRLDIASITDINDDVKRLLMYQIDTWFPAFAKKDE